MLKPKGQQLGGQKEARQIPSRRETRIYLTWAMLLAATIGLAADSPAAPLDTNGLFAAPEARLTPPAKAAEPDHATKTRIVEVYGKLPLSFEANHGQTDDKVKYLARGPGYTLFLTSTEAVLSLRTEGSGLRTELSKPGTKQRAAKDKSSSAEKLDNRADKARRTVLLMRLVGANVDPKISGLDQLPGKSNYLIGNDPEKWHANVPNYAKVKYQDVYPGVDLVYYGNQRQLEYDFVINPGANPKAITLAFQGVEKLEINNGGDLVLHITGSKIIQHAPIVYQEIDGVREPVNGSYILPGKDRIAFQIEAYDVNRPLVIDPVVLTYSSYLGGANADIGNGIAVDSAGNAYVTGSTASVNFPTCGGTGGPGTPPCEFNGTPLQAALANAAAITDAFVTKVNPTGTALVYSTYLGGSNSDVGNGIAVDGAGNAYVTGETSSTNFPTCGGTGGAGTPPCEFNGTPLQAALGNSGFADAFVSKVNPTGTLLVYSTYLGGSNTILGDIGNGIAVDGAIPPNAYVTGETSSTNFPTCGGTGGAGTPPCEFNGTPLQAALGNSGFADAFVSKVNPTGTLLVYSTYLGGSNTILGDIGNGIAVDGAGNAYVTGETSSTNFPTCGGTGGAGTPPCEFNGTPLQAALGSVGFLDAFVTKVNMTGTALVYSTYLGGGNSDFGRGIAMDAADNAYVTGGTASAAPTAFPTTAGAFQTALANAAAVTDAFITELNPTGTALVYSTYLGGGAGDVGNGIALDRVGPNVYVTGSTFSANFPTADSPFQATLSVAPDAFVTKLNPAGTGAADLVYSTYLGGGGGDIGRGIAVDPLDNAYVTGETNSSVTTPPPFPIASFQSTFGGITDAFVSEVTQTTTPPPPPPPNGGGGGGTCFIATAAFGSPLEPHVRLLREFRDRYLLTNVPGRLFVATYYRTSPPLAKVIADSKVLRAVVRTALVPIIGWAALILWSPTFGLGIAFLFLAMAAWPWVGVGRPASSTATRPGSRRTALWRRLILGVSILLIVSGAAFLEAGQENRSPEKSRVEIAGDVHLPQATWFALVRDRKTAHLGLYTDGEAIFEGDNPLPLGKIVRVRNQNLVMALPNARTIDIPRGSTLPGPRGLIFVESVLLDTLRFQLRFGPATTASSTYAVVNIRGRRAILQRDATRGEVRVGHLPAAIPGARGAPSNEPPLVKLANRVSFEEVAPDTWEVPAEGVKEIGNQVWPLLTETLRSATPVVTMRDGVGLSLNNALGSGTLDQQGFRIDYVKMAQRTGLEVGDRILSVNEQPVNSAGGLVRIYRQLKSDASISDVNVVIKRGGQTRTLTYRLR